MSKRLGTAVTLAAVLSTQVGCYTTRAVSQTRPGPEYSDRQWFTIAGLVPLSPPAGRECERGLSSVESKLSFTDWIINVGLGLAGGVVGYLACGNGADPQANALAKSSCASGFAALVPFLVGSRTVEYSCVEGSEGFMPRQEGGYRAPPPPGEGAAPMPPPPPAPAR